MIFSVSLFSDLLLKVHGVTVRGDDIKIFGECFDELLHARKRIIIPNCHSIKDSVVETEKQLSVLLWNEHYWFFLFLQG